MTNPSGEQATNCFARPTSKSANEFTPRSEKSRSASDPRTNKSVMWCD